MSLAVRDLAVRLGGAPVLAGVSAVLEPGTITAICGPNGVGKSTLLSVLAGLITPDAGAVFLDGEVLAHMAAKQRAQRIGYLPQGGETGWDLSVRNLVALGRLPHGDRDSDAVDAAIAACALGRLADRPISRLSGGERARALLARVLAGAPDWILADEPLAALDLAHQLTILRQLRAAADKGAGVVLVLHDLALAMNHADHVLVLGDGKLAAAGRPGKALSQAIIARIWGVDAHWYGTAGARALFIGE